jgi:hypothetical protein
MSLNGWKRLGPVVNGEVIYKYREQDRTMNPIHDSIDCNDKEGNTEDQPHGDAFSCVWMG